MIQPATLPEKCIQILKARTSDEQQAFFFYISAMAWCRLNGYDRSSKYFEVEAHDEQYHYKNIVNFLADWNVNVSYEPPANPVKNFASLQDVFEQAYKMELKLLGQYDEDSRAVFLQSQMVYQFLMEYISIQRYSVTKANEYLKKLYDYTATDPKLQLFDAEVFGEYELLAY